jgi:hypothetical protein
MTTMMITPREDGWTLPVAGSRITRLCLDNQSVRLLCENMIEISIEESFTLYPASRRAQVLDPAGDAMDLAPALQIMRQVIREGTAFSDGRLEIEFADDSRISVPGGTDFEAWTISGPGGPDGLKVVSIPGGDLAIWTGHR